MTTSFMTEVVHHLRRTAFAEHCAGLTDGQLLGCFLEHRDEAAFAALVKRHGPMVWGVCRRILGNRHDAEDAFQATFLVLVRRAASVSPREMVANWLYGVAQNTALKARQTAAKRKGRERQVRDMPEATVTEPDRWRDLQPILDQELGRLPDKHRVVVVLCDLEGKTRKEAARQLGCPEGSVGSRLARARVQLAKRLAQRGVAFSCATLAAALAQEASARVPTAVLASTIHTGSLLAAGQTVTEAMISAKVAALTEGVLKTMLLNKLKTLVLGLLIAALLGGAAVLYRTEAAQPKNEAAQTGQPQADRIAAHRDADLAARESTLENRLPSSPMPRQALVRLDKGRFVVRTLDVVYEPNTVHFEGKDHTSYQKAETVRTMRYDADMAKVYDMKGKRVSKSELGDVLQKEIVALVSTDPEAADPVNLRVFKEGVLLFIFPSTPPLSNGPNHFRQQN
jgi:RNA polymerase sigma factor (sigma-70 family)